MSSRRLAAIGALFLGFAALAVIAIEVVREFPRGLLALACLMLAAIAAWFGVRRTGPPRLAGLALGAVAFVAAIALLASGRLLEMALVGAALLLSLALAAAAFSRHVRLPSRPAPSRPVLFFNPRSGGGKAERFALAKEARARGIEPIELRPGQDLERLVRDAVAGGADGLAMAGGDGSQAVVAAIAAELDLAYACIPAGTRNHFALDLGVDRDDVVGALDAFVDGGERRVDLAAVNERVFVNNVSLGLYAEAVQRSGYRDAKLRTLLETAPKALGPTGSHADLRWRDPDGEGDASGAVILVSNNRYRLGNVLGSGTRPRLDGGVLEITVISAPEGGRVKRRGWTAATFEIDSSLPVAAGIDGEAAKLQPPLRFTAYPGALRVRVASRHPGASPSAAMPDGPLGGIRALAAIAIKED